MARGIWECDNPHCRTQGKKDEELNGWLQLQTVFSPSDKAKQLILAGRDKNDPELAKELPTSVGGEFCSLDCLRTYIANKVLEISDAAKTKLPPPPPDSRAPSPYL